MFIGELNRMAKSSSFRRHNGVQRNRSSRIQQRFPLAGCLGRLALRSKDLSCMVGLFSRTVVRGVEVVFIALWRKANKLLNIVRYRSLGRFAAVLLRAG